MLGQLDHWNDREQEKKVEIFGGGDNLHVQGGKGVKEVGDAVKKGAYGTNAVKALCPRIRVRRNGILGQA